MDKKRKTLDDLLRAAFEAGYDYGTDEAAPTYQQWRDGLAK